jgi:galactokinase
MTADGRPPAAERARREFATHFGPGGNLRVATAPGRVNLIGEHTDYNDGFVLPMAIDRRVAVAFRARSDRTLRVHSLAFAETRRILLDDLDASRGSGWPAYIAGTAWALAKAGVRLAGAEMVIDSDLPYGAGLSSSAALEVAVARALVAAAGAAWEPLAAAIVCRQAENEFVGVPCGVMDQMAAATSRAGQAMLLDCRSLEITPVALPDRVSIVVMDTGIRRTVGSDWYQERLAACRRAVAVAREADQSVRALRDVDEPLLRAIADRLDDGALGCATHVVAENQRVLEMVAVLSRDDATTAGTLINASHDSLRDHFRVSSSELDAIVDIARTHPSCYGARMTGAGFGGCAIALVESSAVDDFVRSTEGAARRSIPSAGNFFRCAAAGGAELVDR